MERIAQLKASQDKAKKKKWRGPRGFPGVEGAIGAQGEIGVTGETGPEGSQGPEGLAGTRGDIGITGETGVTGLQGDRGNRGESGKDGDPGLTGPAGDTGPQGEHGTEGDTGKAGPRGDMGPIGPEGLLGLKGDEGPEGPEGPEGKKGPKGDKGPKGAKGTAGEEGKIGRDAPTNIIAGGTAFMPRNARDKTSAPTVNDDQTVGFLVGSRWYDTTNDNEYVCLDKTTGAAVWIETTKTQEDIEDIVGGMVSGNTETGMTVTYQDSDGTLDFVNDINPFFNGTFRESFNALVTEAGGVVTMTLTDSAGTGTLNMQFSDGLTALSTPATITLTAGSNSAPQINWIYIDKTTKVLTKSTSAWPTTEHIKVGFFFVQSAADVTTDGGTLINQNWNDHLEDSTNQMGHMAHMADRSRKQKATYFNGIDPNGDASTYLVNTAGNTELKSTSGIIYQMHPQTFPAFDTSGSDVVHVKNWSGDAFHALTNLFDIVDDSTGTSIGANKYFNLVLWGVMNKTGEHQTIIINLPAGSYNTQSSAENDVSGFDDFTLPREFNIDSSTGFLICRMTIQMSGTWSHISAVDLRGTTPQTASGGASGVATSFADNQFTVFDETDITKVLALDVGTNVTTGTTRTLTIPDVDGTLITSGNLTDIINAGPNLINSRSTVTAVATDFLLLWDATDSALKKADVNDLLSGGGHTITDDDVAVTDRTNLNFVGPVLVVTDDAGNDASDITLVESAITATGALNAGSITSGFGNIDVGASSIAAGSMDLSEGNITNVGTIECDVLNSDGSVLQIGNETNNVLIFGAADSGSVTFISGAAITFNPDNNCTFSDKNITDVGNIALDSISSDAGTITIGDGADLIVINPTAEVSFSDKNITNVGNIALDSISSDALTTITVTLGTDAGDNLIVGNNSAFVVEGDTDWVGIGTATPDSQVEIQGTSTSGMGLHIDHADIDQHALHIDSLVNDASKEALFITADSQTTGKGIFMSMDGLTSGTGFEVNTISTALASAKLFKLQMSSNLAPAGNLTLQLFVVTASFNFLSDVSSFTWGPTPLFELKRTLVMAGMTNTITSSGAIMRIENNPTVATGTWVNTGAILELDQDNDSTGPTLYIDENRNSTDNAILVDSSAAAQTFAVQSGGDTAIGPTTAAGRLHIDQDSTSGAKPVILLDQADVDEDYFKFIGISDTNVDRALVDAADFTTPGSIAGWLKINIQDDQGTNPITDGDYYIPFYGAPSA